MVRCIHEIDLDMSMCHDGQTEFGDGGDKTRRVLTIVRYGIFCENSGRREPKSQKKKHNAELQRADPGKKSRGD